jgi:hypothetical protein
MSWFGIEGTALEEFTEVVRAELPSAQVSPNPFGPTTYIPYSISSRSPARIDVYDSTGRLIRGFVDGWLDAGTYEVRSDGRDSCDQELPSRIYFVRLQTPSQATARKIVRIR